MITEDKWCNIALNGVFLNRSVWKLYGFNFLITNSSVAKTKFILCPNGHIRKTYSINIIASIFGQIQASKGFNINILNCSMDGNKRLTSTLIDILNCKLSIRNFTFFIHKKYDKGPAIINAVESHIYMVNVNILQNYVLDGLILASNKSVLHVANSTFESNGMLLLTSAVFVVKINNLLLLSNCTCKYNRAFSGPCIYASGTNTITAKNSTFYFNRGIKGGAIYWANKNA